MTPDLISITLLCTVGAILGLLLAAGCCKAALLVRQGKEGADLVEVARGNLHQIQSAEQLVSARRKQRARMLRLIQSEKSQTIPGLPLKTPQISVAVQVDEDDILMSSNLEESQLAEISIHTAHFH